MFPPGTNAPSDIVTVSHIFLGRHVRDHTCPRQQFYVEMPSNADFERPNQLEFPMTVKNFWDGGPDGIIPFDMLGARIVWEKHLDDATPASERLAETQKREREDLEKAQKAVKDDLEDRRQRLEKTVQPLLDKMTPRDWYQQYMAHQGRRRPSVAYAFLGRSG